MMCLYSDARSRPKTLLTGQGSEAEMVAESMQSLVDRKMTILKACPALRHASAETLEGWAYSGKLIRKGIGDVLFFQSQSYSNNAYVIGAGGKFRVIVNSYDIGVHRQREVVGLLEWLQRRRSNAGSVVCAAGCEVVEIDLPACDRTRTEFMKVNPELGWGLAELGARHWRSHGITASISGRRVSAAGRLAKVIDDCAESKSSHGQHHLPPLTHEELARMANIDRSSVGMLLRQFVARGVLEKTTNSYAIADETLLRAVVDGSMKITATRSAPGKWRPVLDLGGDAGLP